MRQGVSERKDLELVLRQEISRRFGQYVRRVRKESGHSLNVTTDPPNETIGRNANLFEWLQERAPSI